MPATRRLRLQFFPPERTDPFCLDWQRARACGTVDMDGPHGVAQSSPKRMKYSSHTSISVNRSQNGSSVWVCSQEQGRKPVSACMSAAVDDRRSKRTSVVAGFDADGPCKNCSARQALPANEAKCRSALQELRIEDYYTLLILSLPSRSVSVAVVWGGGCIRVATGGIFSSDHVISSKKKRCANWPTFCAENW